jgi:orotate phosphoribosyltransferase
MLIDTEFARQLASDLLEINAVLLRPNEPFVWSSGWRSPIYCDNRKTLNYPDIRSRIAARFSQHILATAPGVDVITGTATAGIPHAAIVADRLQKPMAYVRAQAKSHGTGNQIEGGVKKGQTTIVIEDLISTGTSVGTVVDALKIVSAQVVQVLAIFTYGFDVAFNEFKERNIPTFTLTDYNTLIQVALEKNYIQKADLELLEDWRSRPSTWPNPT